MVWLILIVIIGIIIYLRWTLYNTPNGERYLKMRMQGPFVPAGEDEVKTDKNELKK